MERNKFFFASFKSHNSPIVYIIHSGLINYIEFINWHLYCLFGYSKNTVMIRIDMPSHATRSWATMKSQWIEAQSARGVLSICKCCHQRCQRIEHFHAHLENILTPKDALIQKKEEKNVKKKLSLSYARAVVVFAPKRLWTVCTHVFVIASRSHKESNSHCFH